MKPGGIKYEFDALPWVYAGPGGWHFVSLPSDMATEIRGLLQSEEEGWGRLKAHAKMGQSEWDTAIWYDTKHKTYLLPLKAAIRKREQINIGKSVTVTIWI